MLVTLILYTTVSTQAIAGVKKHKNPNTTLEVIIA